MRALFGCKEGENSRRMDEEEASSSQMGGRGSSGVHNNNLLRPLPPQHGRGISLMPDIHAGDEEDPPRESSCLLGGTSINKQRSSSFNKATTFGILSSRETASCPDPLTDEESIRSPPPRIGRGEGLDEEEEKQLIVPKGASEGQQISFISSNSMLTSVAAAEAAAAAASAVSNGNGGLHTAPTAAASPAVLSEDVTKSTPV